MRRFLILLAIAIGSLGLAQTNPDPVVAKVNGKEILKSYFDMQFGLFVRSMLRQQGQPYSEEAATQFESFKADYLTRMARDEAFIQAATAAGFEASQEQIEESLMETVSEFETQEELDKALAEAGVPSMEAYRGLVAEALTYNAYIEHLQSKIEISSPALQIMYLLSKPQFRVPVRYCAAHILVETAKEANDIIAQLGKGAKFADLAKKSSKDPGSAEDGGELGCEPRGTFVAPFESAMASLKPGQYTRQPVRTEFGFHVILLSKVEPSGYQPFETIQPRLQEGVVSGALRLVIDNVVSKAKIELFPENAGIAAK